MYSDFFIQVCKKNMRGFKGISEKLGRANEYDLTEKQDDAQIKSEKGPPGFGYRHSVALWCFFYFFITNGHFSLFPMTIVAMVNRTQSTNQIDHLNESVTTCPLPLRTENISTKFKVREGTFNWDSELRGYAIGVGAFGYMFTNVFAGRVAETYGAKRTILIIDFCNILLTCVCPVAATWSVYALIAVLFFRGLVQGAILPSLFVMMANWFPRSERGLFSGFALCGISVGASVFVLVFGKLCDVPSLGWQSAYYFLGGFNFFSSIIYLLTFHEVPKIHPYISKEELKYIVGGQESDMSRKRPAAPWRKILTSIPVYALIIGKTGLYWSASHFTYVHPTYMGTVLHFSMTENGLNSSFFFTAMLVGTVMSMFLSNWIRKKNYLGVDQSRKWCNSISSFGFALCVVGVLIANCDKTTNLVCCVLALMFSGFGISGSWIVNGDMSPVFSGSLSGISSCVAMFTCSLMPVIVGALTKKGTLDEWQVVFGIHIAFAVISGLIFHIFGSAEIQPWNSAGSPESNNPTDEEFDETNKLQIEEKDTATN